MRFVFSLFRLSVGLPCFVCPKFGFVCLVGCLFVCLFWCSDLDQYSASALDHESVSTSASLSDSESCVRFMSQIQSHSESCVRFSHCQIHEYMHMHIADCRFIFRYADGDSYSHCPLILGFIFIFNIHCQHHVCCFVCCCAQISRGQCPAGQHEQGVQSLGQRQL